ncbi:MAG: AAA family ATPase [Motiliproteus sp.]|nr:AAA family ATPase [Motiliproteus sp.]MCW9053096.1 AAA family ATPase [Motiliproteus sp.]
MTQTLLDRLQNPALYDHPVEQFQLLETHISWILLTGPYVYKIRKPVDFGFLDFTSLEKRLDDCQEELRLNPRLSPQLYCGLAVIYGSAEAPSFHSSEDFDRPIEYAVKMRQFEQSSLLSEMDSKGDLKQAHIDNMAEILAKFHQSIPVAPLDSSFGSPDTLWSVISQNFEQIRPRLLDDSDRKLLNQLENWSQQQFQQLRPQILQRKQDGYIREGHGDLHLGNIAIYNNEICPFDCIEFNPKYRWVDTLNDTAFLLMDLEARGHHHFARRLLDRYLECSGDYLAIPLLKLFKAYRTMVRAKVTLLSAPDLNPSSMQTYRRYAQLASDYTQKIPASLILMHGVSGSGKSWLSSRLLQQQEFIRLRSDVIRKQLKFSEIAGADKYNHQAIAHVYQQLLAIARHLLGAGCSVVVDATFLKQDQRSPFIELAQQLKLPLHIIACVGNQQQLRDRILSRSQTDDPSEATVHVMQAQLADQHAFSETEQPLVIEVDTENADLSALVNALQG